MPLQHLAGGRYCQVPEQITQARAEKPDAQVKDGDQGGLLLATYLMVVKALLRRGVSTRGSQMHMHRARLLSCLKSFPDHRSEW